MLLKEIFNYQRYHNVHYSLSSLPTSTRVFSVKQKCQELNSVDFRQID
jgi:mannose/fructose/N-acetylgalactosamine-specific phosphotransferase system component IID